MLFKVINFYFCASRWVLVINVHQELSIKYYTLGVCTTV